MLDRYLLAKPTVSMLIEWPILIGIGIIGNLFSWHRIPLHPTTNVAGAILLIMGLVIHVCTHETLKKHGIRAHHPSKEVKQLATSGIYSKIRHPSYLGLILIYFGFALGCGIVWTLVPAVIFSVMTYLTAIREEEVLKEKFGEEYEGYMRQVPWRFIPKVF